MEAPVSLINVFGQKKKKKNRRSTIYVIGRKLDLMSSPGQTRKKTINFHRDIIVK
jgi:hypothetical protein